MRPNDASEPEESGRCGEGTFYKGVYRTMSRKILIISLLNFTSERKDSHFMRHQVE